MWVGLSGGGGPGEVKDKTDGFYTRFSIYRRIYPGSEGSPETV